MTGAVRAKTGTQPRPARALAVMKRLRREFPDAKCALSHETPHQLLVATILSAQCTDARVNAVTPELFATYPDARALAAAGTEALERQIQSTGFFRMKARSLVGMSQALLDKHHGMVPASMDDLVVLPGVGRKTANVVLGHALGVPGLPVDRHVLRVANRLGLVSSDDPVAVESRLCSLLPPERWTRASDALILHGRRVCRPTPQCDRCQVRHLCRYFKTLGRKAAPRRTAARRQ